MFNKYTIVNQQDIRRKLSYLFGKNVLLSIKGPDKFATTALVTKIASIESNHIILDGFQDDQFSKDLLMQNALEVSANFEGIAVNFRLSGFTGHDFNLKAPLPESMEWVQRRSARRVKVPIKLPVKLQFKNQAEYFDVADISIAGLSYIDQTEGYYFAAARKVHKDINIILPDNSVCVASFEIVNNTTIPCKFAGQTNRVGCEIRGGSYRLDTALQHLINQIDLYSKREDL